jgi:hypothetical protein
MDQRHTAVLIIRAWVELHPSSPLRASIRSTSEVGAGFGASENFADVEAAIESVRTWLRDIEAGRPVA